jgi:hypothetical protein
MIVDFIEFLIGWFNSLRSKKTEGWSIHEKVIAAIAITWLIIFLAAAVLLSFFKETIFPGYQ